MQHYHLYILAFRDEPIIKVGIAEKPKSRFRQLGLDRFDFSKSYLVQAQNRVVITLLERSLKVLLGEHRRESVRPLESGNTEIFCETVVPQMMGVIESFRKRLEGLLASE